MSFIIRKLETEFLAKHSDLLARAIFSSNESLRLIEQLVKYTCRKNISEFEFNFFAIKNGEKDGKRHQ